MKYFRGGKLLWTGKDIPNFFDVLKLCLFVFQSKDLQNIQNCLHLHLRYIKTVSIWQIWPTNCPQYTTHFFSKVLRKQYDMRRASVISGKLKAGGNSIYVYVWLECSYEPPPPPPRMPPSTACVRTLSWFVSYRHLSPQLKYSLSAAALGIYFYGLTFFLEALIWGGGRFIEDEWVG